VNKCRVLLVDDDERLLNAAKRILRKNVDIHTAEGGAAALKILQESEPFSVLVSDQNMPDMDGARLLEQASKRWPMMTRIMLTGNNDLTTAATAINSGRIFRFLNKPCQPEELLAAIEEGHRQYNLVSGEKALLEKTLSGSVKVLVDVLALSNPKAFHKAAEVRKLLRFLSQKMEIPRFWELEVASMLWPLGGITLPGDLMRKVEADELLSAPEQALVERAPQSAHDLISNIPRMENIANAILYSAKGYDGTGFPRNDIKGSDIPQQARLLRILIDFVQIKINKMCSHSEALTILSLSESAYDPVLLKTIGALLAQAEKNKPQEQIVEVTPLGLRQGDIVARDIFDDRKKMLLAAGNEITALTIARLRSMSELKLVTKPIYVRRDLASKH